jgi:uncharacterized membrane protein YhaH (DUF805 family)
MNAVRTTLRELWGLFVDDGSLALALILWCIAAGLILPRVLWMADWNAPILFLGCLVILLSNVAVAVRRLR